MNREDLNNEVFQLISKRLNFYIFSNCHNEIWHDPELILGNGLRDDIVEYVSKVLKGNWIDKPDSEGWWWYKEADNKIEFVAVRIFNEGIREFYLDWDRSRVGYTWIPPRRSGKWSKAIVPEVKE